MTASASASRIRGWQHQVAASPTFVAFLGGIMVLTASLANFLRFNDYPLLSPEVAWIILGFVAIAALAAWAYRGSERLGRALLEGLLVFLAIDLNADLIWLALAGGVLTAALALALKRSLMPFLGTMALIMFLVGLLGIGQQSVPASAKPVAPAAPAAKRPALLHLILDEHIGIEGLPADHPATPAMKQALSDFYLSRGFRLYGRAYSEHFHTVNSIPHILNYATPENYEESREGGHRVGPTPYFARLQQLGYRIHAYQSEYLDFCTDAKVVSCLDYSSSSLALVPATRLSTGEKAGLIAVQFSRLSDGVRGASALYQMAELALRERGITIPDMGLRLEGRTSTINALAAFDTLTADLAKAQPGDAYFAHILVPHYPYSLNADCTLAPTDFWLVRRDATSLARRESAYFDQLRCATAKLDTALRGFAASPGGRDGIVIVHGDHGSRITELDPIVENLGRFSDRDMISGFSTLFAVRAPGAAPGYDATVLPVATLVKALAQSDFQAVPPAKAAPATAIVTLDDAGWIPRKKHPLPRSWSTP